MTSEEFLSCEKLRTAFERREAIYVEKGVLRVRVSRQHELMSSRLCHDAKLLAVSSTLGSTPRPASGQPETLLDRDHQVFIRRSAPHDPRPP